MIKWKEWARRPGELAVQALIQQFPTANVGIVTGLSALTVVDVDDAALINPMLDRFGVTPMQTSTPSGGAHLWYLSFGERCMRRLDRMLVDIRGKGGIIIVPPSFRHGRGQYRFQKGSWSDVPNLTHIKPGSLNTGPLIVPRSVPQGTRNNTLFNYLLHEAWACDDFDSLLDVAQTFNMDCGLPELEVAKTTRSVWRLHQEGTNWTRGPARIVLTAGDDLDKLLSNTDALALYVRLKTAHGARAEPFAIACKEMAAAGVVPAFKRTHDRYRRARNWLLANGFLHHVHKGTGKGNPHLFTLGTKGLELGPNINKHPPGNGDR